MRTRNTIKSKNKILALKKFQSELKRHLNDRISGIHLFGSLAKGKVRKASDIDVLVIYYGINKNNILDRVLDIAFKIACETGEVIETILMSEKEYGREVGSSPFLPTLYLGGLIHVGKGTGFGLGRYRIDK